MPTGSRIARLVIPPIVALLVISILFLLSQPRTFSEQETNALASRFQFSKHPFPELSGRTHKTVRDVHRSMQHISAMISFVGAAVALADLDGDGLPNDLVHVDPRVDQVIIAPVPGTKDRYKPFALDSASLPFESATMAPMGCLVGDFNEDGLADVLVYYWGRSPVLFLQLAAPSLDGPVVLAPNRFVPSELVEPYQRWFTGAVTQADLDGDGHLDLIVGNYFPDGARVLDANALGMEAMPHSLSHAFNGGRKHFFLGAGGEGGTHPTVRFREADAGLEDEVSQGWTFALGAADLDGDLLPEIYFVHDWGPDRLVHNRSRPGQLRFALLQGERTWTTPRSKVLGCDTFNGMGIDFADLNGDGWPDMFVSNITSNYGFHESNFVFESTGKVESMRAGVAPYRDVSEKLGLSRGGWGWDVKFGDFDNDGLLEIVQATGYVRGAVSRWPETQELALGNDEVIAFPATWPQLKPGDDVSGSDHNPFFVRTGNGRYQDLASPLGLGEPSVSRAIATADVDGDGKLDFAVANQWGPSFFFSNTAPRPGAFLGLNLRLPAGRKPPTATQVLADRPPLKKDRPSRPAIGASATVTLPDGRRLVSQVDGGTGHAGKRSPELHFGLGQLNPSDTVRVDLRWRHLDGSRREETLNLKPNRWHTVLLGEVPAEQKGVQQ
jgi:hypothetical protein